MWAPLYYLSLESAFLLCSLQNPVTQHLQSIKASTWTVVDPPTAQLHRLEALDGSRTAAGTYQTMPSPGRSTGQWSSHGCRLLAWDLCQAPLTRAARSSKQSQGQRSQRAHGPNMHYVPLTSLQSRSSERSVKGSRLPGSKAVAPSSQSTASFWLKAGKGEAQGFEYCEYSLFFSFLFLISFLSQSSPFPSPNFLFCYSIPPSPSCPFFPHPLS